MNNLSIELLDQIFKELPLPQKQECAFVCKKWAQVIHTRSIFHTIKLKSEQLYDCAMDFFKRYPYHGARVEYLELQGCVPLSFDTRNFLRLFPNLNTIRIIDRRNSSFGHDNSVNTSQEFELDHKKNRLELIQDTNSWVMTRFLVENKMCNQLKSLSLSSRGDQVRRKLPALMDMPSLKELTVTGFILTFADLEMVHTYLPSLEKLRFGSVDVSTAVLPPGITPALSVTHVSGDVLETPRYALAKYPNLEHLDFTTGEYTTKDQMESYYTNELVPIIQRSGPQLKSLTLDLPEYYPDIIKRLDEFGCQIKSLNVITHEKNSNIIQALAHSKQKESIEELTLDFPIISLQYLKELKRLKKLFLNHFLVVDFDHNDSDSDSDEDDEEEDDDECCYGGVRGRPLDLNEVLECCPNTCESLSIVCGRLKFNSDITEKYLIKELKLDNIELDTPGIDKFISKALPDLRSLTLKTYSTVTSLCLPEHHFSSLHFANTQYPFYINVKLISSDRKPCFYTSEDAMGHAGYGKFNQYCLPTPQEKLRKLPFITLTCASVEKLTINNKEAYLVSDMNMFKSLNTTRYANFPTHGYYKMKN